MVGFGAGDIVWAGPAPLPPHDHLEPRGEMKDASAAALAAVWSTALPTGLTKVHTIDAAFALGYPRTIGAFDPTSAESIVVVESSRRE